MSPSAFEHNCSDHKPGDIAQKANIIKESFGKINNHLVYLFNLIKKKGELIKITNYK